MYVSEEERAAFLKALHAGVEHFNARRFHEAYDVWQERWENETTEGADLLQGLLQMAVAFSKIESGNPQAAQKLLQTCVPLIDGYPEDAYDLDIGAILSAAQTTLAQLTQIPSSQNQRTE